ncbi:MAG: hypothetical protein GQ582_08725 [Methyloprofundus sp.]|nr:hypothetical protein [Methyloprofundus sp.]
MAIDKAERFVVTASDDKTARVWDVATGQLLQTLRPPIGLGGEGKLYAVAISPATEQIAVAGWTGYQWDKTHSIYLFNRSTGKMQGRIRGLPKVIFHLSYSADGLVLAVALGAGEGVRFYSTTAIIKGEYQELARGSNYTQSSYSIDFDAQGRSISTSDDGYLRLYNTQFKKVVEKKVAGGSEPFFARFSPDNSRIAVGFDDSTAVSLVSAKDLSPLASPKTELFTQGSLNAVAWSKNGKQLYAAGRYDNGQGNPIITWATADWTGEQAYAAAQTTVMDILPLADGGLLFASADPAGRLDKQGQKVWKQGAGKLDYSGYTALRDFKLSESADTVHFHYRYENTLGQVERKTALWDLKQLGLTAESQQTLYAPLLKNTELDVQQWEAQYQPQLNGSALSLRSYERSRSLAIARPIKDKLPAFVLGTEWQLRFYNHLGKQQWEQTVSIAWAVNISANRRYVVAALGGGTIRWYQTSDGKERLALYLHPEAITDQANPRWIAWAPDGFYATSSQAAESLMGFHLNQGADKAAKFVAASQLSRVFDRADLVARALDDDYPQLAAQALKKSGDINSILNAGLAPNIHLLGGTTRQLKSRHFNLQFSLEDLGDGIGKIEYWVDGKLVAANGTRAYAPRLPAGQQGYQRDFTLDHGKHRVVVKAFNQKNEISAESEPLMLEVNDPYASS